MSHRASGIIWLVVALLCGLLSLASCAGAGYGIWYVEDRLATLNETIAKDEKDFADPKNQKEMELSKRLKENDAEKNEFEKYRYFSYAGAAISLIPLVMTFAFLLMAFAKLTKKPRPRKVEEAAEDDEVPAEDVKDDG